MKHIKFKIKNFGSHELLYVALAFLFGSVGVLVFSFLYVQNHRPPRQIIYPTLPGTGQKDSNAISESLAQVTSFDIKDEAGFVQALAMLGSTTTGSMSAKLQQIELSATAFSQQSRGTLVP